MGIPAVGDVVLVNFPFASLKKYKKRPALVVAHGSLNTAIICQITSRKLPNVPAIELNNADFTEGGLLLQSYIRPNMLITYDLELAGRQQLGRIAPKKLHQVKTAICDILMS